MFAYLSKKIAVPNGYKLKSISWNTDQGYIACGGENGMLKVLQLDSGRDPKAKAGGNLTMNQTLEGHNGDVMVVTWNEGYRKLTTSDQQGLIIVWMLHKGKWFEEMINNRNKSVVKDMKWTPEGQKICIVYEDGAVIVGSVDGNRLWGKELEMELSLVEWSPDGRLILFCTPQGECHIYDSNGNGISKMTMHCMEEYVGTAKIVGVEWYDGLEGYPEPNCPVLAVGLDNGRMQIMRSELDDQAVLIDTSMRIATLKWNSSGTVLAVVGSQSMNIDGTIRDASMVQFYSYLGDHLRTLRVPGSGIRAVSWEGGGLRLAMAVESYIYFANVRPDYKWGYFASTLVYAFTQLDRVEHCIMFWDTKNNDRYAKYVKRLLAIRAAGDYCVLATKGEAEKEYILILCNAIGSPVDSKYISCEPRYLAITPLHIIAASDDVIYIWQYRTSRSKLTLMDLGSLSHHDGHERIFHIDEVPGPANTQVDRWRPPLQASLDPISAIAANTDFLLVGRASGVVNRYSLPDLQMEGKYRLRCRPQTMAMNCDASRMSIIDINGVLSFFDLKEKNPDGTTGVQLEPERKDVWDMVWAGDNPELFACMEKSRMYIFRGLDPEEPVTSSAHLCGFNDLEITAARLDEIMQQPDMPNKEQVITYETRSLRDTRKLLETASLQDTFAFVDDNPHPRLWRILAEYALERREYPMADRGFVLSADYQGIQFVKRLQELDGEQKQRAEILIHFRRFDEAEQLYLDMDRPDLAIDMRSKLGDWFQVEKLLKIHDPGADAKLVSAWNNIGEYFADRHKWHKARNYFTQAKNSERLAECFYHLDDFNGLEKLMQALPEGSPLLLYIGEKLQSVGLCEQGVAAFVKGGDVKKAINCCMLLNQWDQATALAEQYDFPQTNAILQRHAAHLLEKALPMDAIQLFRKASMHAEAAKLLQDVAKQQRDAAAPPLRIKKLFVLAALEVERFKAKQLAGADGTLAHLTAAGVTTAGGPRQTKTAAATTLAGLMTLDAAAAMATEDTVDNAWRGAEAYHFWILAHRHLYNGHIQLAVRTALNLRKYEDIIPPKDIYCFLALASFYGSFFGTCSKAFVKLESHPSVPDAQRSRFADLAMSIFVKNDPIDPKDIKEARNNALTMSVKGGNMQELLAARKEKVCVASGKIIKQNAQTLQCRTCRHHMLVNELGDRDTCPLCHAAITR